MPNYRTIEKRVWDSLEPLKAFTSTASKTIYACAITPLRIPTFIRKARNMQLMIQRMEKIVAEKGIESIGENWEYNQYGGFAGLVSGLVATGFGLEHICQEFTNGNYVPVIATASTILASNLISGIFEIGRREKSQTEYEEAEDIREILQKKYAATNEEIANSV